MSVDAADSSATVLQQQRLYEDRWSAYGANAGLLHLSSKPSASELKRFDLFKPYDDQLLDQLSPDISIAKWEKGAILFEEGSYLDVAFYIVEGTVSLFLDKHATSASQPIFDTKLVEAVASEPSQGDGAAQTAFVQPYQPPKEKKEAKGKKKGDGANITYLASMDFDLAHGEEHQLGRGDIFGEIGALNGWPQSVTARTATDCTLVQIRLPALQKLKLRSSDFKEWVDKLYRERTLSQQLKTTPLFRGTDDRFVEQLANRVELISCSPGDVVTEEGAAVDAFYLVRSGFLRVSQKVGDGEVAVTYLRKGMTLGEVELLIDGLDGWQTTVTSVGFTELVRIPRADFESILRDDPAVRQHLWAAAINRIKETGYTKQNPEQPDLIEFSLAKGLVQGNSILVIDLDVCTRCDDCVRGCASTHDGRPRFVREGDRYDNFLIARSCYHCEDPVCLIGCPTGAIRRTNVGEVVAVDDNICIGCGNCANKCPYDAIVMHDTEEVWPDTALPEFLRGRDRRVASKCDLCYESDAGPACVNNCPHACAFRINSIEDFQQLQAVDHAQR
ncbi:MAG: cyclic nucleotide-binding domain-containing protein [Rhodothermales bacterium]